MGERATEGAKIVGAKDVSSNLNGPQDGPQRPREMLASLTACVPCRPTYVNDDDVCLLERRKTPSPHTVAHGVTHTDTHKISFFARGLTAGTNEVWVLTPGVQVLRDTESAQVSPLRC